MTTKVGFIGLGNMGTPMARRLVGAGASVRGFDVSVDARARLVGAGGAAAESAVDAARGADAVILMLPSSDVVDAVAEELLREDAIGAGTLVIDMSSSEPVRTRELAARVTAVGASFADAPVSGGVGGAENGRLTVMLGSEESDRERAHELLASLGRVVDCGPVAAGHALKALNNLLSATHLWATGEAIEVGVRFGLDPAVMVDVINGSSGRSGSTDNKWPNFVLTGTYGSGFGLRLMLKDMRIATNLAEQVGLPSRLGEQAVALWDEAAHALPDDADHTRVADWIATRPTDGETDGREA